MSKGADDETEMEEGMTTSERRRRRRRGAGLRIPSDNVPRRSGPVVAPVPEDPAVAMSIAYAFDDSSAPTRLPTGELDAAGEGLGDMEDSTAFSPPPVPPPSPDGSMPSLEDIVPDGRTRQMAAVSLEALGLSDVEEELHAMGGNGAPSGDVDIDVDGLDDASDDAQADDDDEGDDFGENEAPIQRRPATIPPPMTVADAAASIRADAAASIRAAAGAKAAAEVSAKATAAVAASGGDAVPQARMSRAATLALSEDDLEELLEATPAPQKAPLPPSASAAARQTSGIIPISPNAQVPASPTAPAAAASPPVAASVADALSAAPTGPLASMSAAPIAPNVGNTTGEAVALAEEDLQEVAGPADAGDSGEIFADEIMEVEQDTRAPVAVGPQTSGPVTLPSSPGSSGTHPLGTHAAPPPPPAAQHAKPPAAPPKKSLTARHAQAAAVAAPSAESDARRGKRRGKPWFEEIFDEDYLRTLPFLTPQATQAEALMVIESLGVQAGAAVLDVGCGYGRHAMELAARGYHVVGVDLSLPLLLRGADEAQRRGLDINFVHADMREMDFDAQFDGAYCLFSTFGFFDDETNKKTAALIAKSLKPGAKFMLEILNRDYVIGDLPARVWWEGDGCVVLEEVEFNYFSSRVQSKRSVVFDDGRQVEQEISVRVYSLHEVGKLLHAAGLRVLEVSGSMASRGRFLGTRSREIIVVAERRPPDGKS